LAAPLLACQAWAQEDTLPDRKPAVAGCRDCSRIKVLLFKVEVVIVISLALLSGLLLWQCTNRSLTSRIFAPQSTGLSKQLELNVNNRSVLVYAPAIQLKSKSLPMVIVLHGSYASNVGFADLTRYHQVMESAVVLYPEMRIPKGPSWEYSAPCETTFFRSLPAAVVKAGYNVDTSQIFVVGHSSGGTMSLYLQNNMPDVFRAAAAVESGVGFLDQWHNQSSGRPAMVIWNHNDPVLNWFGGEALYSTTLRQLRRHDPRGAKTGPSSVGGLGVALPEVQTSAVEYAERLAWPPVGRSPALEVVSWKSMDPTHQWASPRFMPGAFNAASVTWSFFQRVAQPPLHTRSSSALQHSHRGE
jgi:poly(3-hydroxybutyrate) depolymerase